MFSPISGATGLHLLLSDLRWRLKELKEKNPEKLPEEWRTIEVVHMLSAKLKSQYRKLDQQNGKCSPSREVKIRTSHCFLLKSWSLIRKCMVSQNEFLSISESWWSYCEQFYRAWAKHLTMHSDYLCASWARCLKLLTGDTIMDYNLRCE